MKKLFISMLLAAIQLAASASADVTVASTFTFNVDAANSATYSSNPGSDAGAADDYTADSPMTIPVSGFTAAGTSKLVAVVSLHNSSRPVAPVTEITYGGVSIIANVAGGNSPAGASSSRQMVFYLDNVATDGNLVLTWGPGNVDEVSVALFALNGAQTGTASYSELKNGNATLSAFNATQGDFLVGVGQRNNGTNSVASGVGYTAVDLLAGNLNAEAAYKIATSTGSNSAPTFSSITSTNGVTQTMVAFAAIPVSQVAVPVVVGLTQAAAESAIAGATLTVGTVTTSYSPTVPSGDVISQNPLGGVNVNVGTSVSLVVSLGPPPTVNVPDVVGLAQAAAESAITGASLTVGAVTNTYSSTVASGTVISQNPTAGASVVTGSSVDLVVSLGPPSGLITIVDTFSFSVDAGNSATYSSSPGSDGSLSDLYGADNPLTISTTGFTAAGTDKLVAVLSLHNSAVQVAPVTSLTYGGVSIYGNLVTGASPSGTANTKTFIFYLDDVTTDGDFVIGFDDSTYNIDEVGLVLFALNGTESGTAYAFETRTSGAFTPANAAAGDFIVGVSQRNNQGGTITVTNSPPYAETDISSGNLTARTGHQVASVSGSTAPAFSGAAQIEAMAAFAAAAAPVTSAYDIWAATNAPVTGGDLRADEDDDGVTNGIEFVVGGTISNNDLDKLPTALTDGTNMTFSFERAQQSINPSVAVSIEVGANLVNWPDIYQVPGAATAGPPMTVVKDSSPGFDTVTLSVPMAPFASRFARLKVSAAP